MYYGIKGKPGFLHSACLDEYCTSTPSHTARPHHQPTANRIHDPDAVRGKCILCDGWLAELAISFNERAARALASKPADLRKRLQDAKSVLTREYAKRFGKGRFDFHGKRLVGENGLILQWLTRMYPDQPISYRNQQTNRGTVVRLEIID